MEIIKRIEPDKEFQTQTLEVYDEWKEGMG
jgi:hypothetical protein